MQKVWRQIGFTMDNLGFLNEYMYEYQLKNESAAISKLIDAHKKFQVIVGNLEKAAWKDTAIIEQDVFKKRVDKE